MSTTTFTEKWTKIRELGRSKFVLRYGVLGWGVSTAILFSLIWRLTRTAGTDSAFEADPVARHLSGMGGSLGADSMMCVLFLELRRRSRL